MGRRVYRANVLAPGFKTTKKEYKAGDVYKTKHKPSFDYLIKTQRIR